MSGQWDTAVKKKAVTLSFYRGLFENPFRNAVFSPLILGQKSGPESSISESPIKKILLVTNNIMQGSELR